MTRILSKLNWVEGRSIEVVLGELTLYNSASRRCDVFGKHLLPMTAENPYDSPPPSKHAAHPSLIPWTIGSVFGCAFIGGLIGTGLGAALGVFAPGYYRSVFSNGDSPIFDPLAVGVGQGLTQGVVFGGVVGVLLVGMFYWFRARTLNRA